MEKNYDFEWDVHTDNISDFEMQKAKELLNLNMIQDVYENNNYVTIEYLFNCKNSFIENLSTDAVVKKMKVPMKLSKKTRCGYAESYNCKFEMCIVILAAYLFYTDRKNNYYNNVIEDFDVWEEEDEVEEKVPDQYNDLTEQNILNIFTDQEKKQYETLIRAINTDDLLSIKIKQSFFKLIKSVINFKKIENTNIKRPNYNYSISENTDTVNSVCMGQLKCINTIKLILQTFDMIDESKEIKYVNFRELGTCDSLQNPKNYEADIIVFTNIHYLTNKNLIRGGESTQENAMAIKNNIGSYIMEHSNDKIFIICDKEINIREFFTNNQQLSFQFQKIKIKDLKHDQIQTIFMNRLKKNKQIRVDSDFEKDFSTYIDNNYIYSPYKNLEFVEFIFNDAMKRMIGRNADLTLKASDLPVFKNNSVNEYDDLNELVGLNSVKKVIRDLQAYLEFKKEKEAFGDKMPDTVLHMAFYGNPGTGKTTVARLMAGILFNLEYIRYNKCIECESKDLIANVAGETALKTSEKIQEAMGGILFIDEAYAIGSSAYGAECIATLIKAMEDYRDDLIIILAGYRTEMMQFLEINSGFKSRIFYELEFEDYDNEELLQMTQNLFAKYNMTVADYNVLAKIETIYTNEKRKDQRTFGNSRFVRNTVDKILRIHAINVQTLCGIEDEEIINKRRSLITLDDVKIDSND